MCINLCVDLNRSDGKRAITPEIGIPAPCAGPIWAAHGGPQTKNLVYWVLISRSAKYTEKRRRRYLRLLWLGQGVYSGRPGKSTQ